MGNQYAVPASSVLVFTDTGLGSPTPTLFFASTRKSYSTQALRSTTVAVSVFPSIISGTKNKRKHCRWKVFARAYMYTSEQLQLKQENNYAHIHCLSSVAWSIKC